MAADRYRVGIIGTGPTPDDPGPDGFAMGYRHANGYRNIDRCELIACADIEIDHARRFADVFDLEYVFENYKRMLQECDLDLVSVCVPPDVHAEIVDFCLSSGLVEAVHCEKPMAKTWSECRQMVETMQGSGVQLTFNHQRRFGKPFRAAKELLDAGSIGQLNRIEFSGDNLYDFGTHLFDLSNFYVDQEPVDWVISQIDYRDPNILFGAHNENQAISQWRYANGVFGLASTEDEFVGCMLRLDGSTGSIEIGSSQSTKPLRMKRDGETDWQGIDTGGEGVHGPEPPSLFEAGVKKLAEVAGVRGDAGGDRSSLHERSLRSVVDAVDRSTKSELDAENALAATELIFASWESARRTGRVELPLRIDDNPLEAMIDEGRVLTDE